MEDAQRYKNMLDKNAFAKEALQQLKNVKSHKKLTRKEYVYLKREQREQVTTDLTGRKEEINKIDKCLSACRIKHDELHTQYHALVKEYNNSVSAKYAARNAFYNMGDGDGDGDGGEKVIYQKSCPQQDCKGFLSQNGVCGICHVDVCCKCSIVKGVEQEDIGAHKCKKEDIESVEAIRKETKPCPRCGTRIHKIDGCDQMWCPYCQDKYGEGTAFSWITGKIERGRIHNPHFIDYMHNNNPHIREVGDVHCGGLPEIHLFDRKLTAAKYGGWYVGYIPYETRVRAMNIMRRVFEINQYVVNPLREKMREQNVHKMDQINHILGISDDVKFRRAISRTEKAREREQEVLDIFEVVVTVLTERINQVYNNTCDLNVIMFLSFVEEFVKTQNRCLAEISYNYKQSTNYVVVDLDTQYNHNLMNMRLTTKKELEYYKKTNKLPEREVKKVANKVAREREAREAREAATREAAREWEAAREARDWKAWDAAREATREATREANKVVREAKKTKEWLAWREAREALKIPGGGAAKFD
jgi:hypothetical protein